MEFEHRTDDKERVMAFSFDHAIIAVSDLDKAVENYRSVGFSVIYGGEHAAGTTHNAIIPFKDGTYLELIAKTGKMPYRGENPSDLSHFVRDVEGVSAVALRCDDLKAQVALLKQKGVEIADPIFGERRRGDGVQVKWYQVSLPADWPVALLIEDETPRNLRVPEEEKQVTHANGAQGIKSLMYISSDTDATTKNLKHLLGSQIVETDLGSTFYVDEMQINVSRPEAKLTKMFHDENGDSVWRLVLRGVGDMYKRLSTASLHGANIIIAGER
jgi:catechol 2,3-dioxygenase-like lactoylglutathione lyase family enzyme